MADTPNTQPLPWWKVGERLLNAACFFLGSILFGGMLVYTGLEWFQGYMLKNVSDPDLPGGLFGMAFAFCLASPPPNHAQGQHLRMAYLAVLCGGLLWVGYHLETGQVALNEYGRIMFMFYLGIPAVLRLAQFARGVRS